MNSRLIANLRIIISSPIVVYCFVFIFILLKSNHLFTPYFWDELGVYSKASLYMYDNQISLFPGVIPPELSRGHPLLCAALFAVAYKIFGPYVWVGHVTALFFSCIMLLVLYRGAKNLSNHSIGLLSCLLLMVQPVFIAQSSMVLPEVLLALFSTAAIFAYIGNRLFYFAVLSSLAILTKETAIAIPVTVWSIEVIRWFLGKKREALISAFAASAPIMCWAIFLVLQKQAHDWYFFPLHSEYVSFSIGQIISRACYYLSFLFKGQGRILWSIILIFALVVYFSKNIKNILQGMNENTQGPLVKKAPLLILGIFIFWGVVVSMLNFHLGRYSLFILPALCFIVAQSFLYSFEKIGVSLKSVVVLALLLLPFLYYESRIFNFDADMGFAHVVEVQKLATDYLNDNYENEIVVMDSFPINTGFMENRSGYTSKNFHHIDKPCTSPQHVNADIFIYSYPGNLEYCSPEIDRLTLLKEFKSSFANVLIYKK